VNRGNADCKKTTNKQTKQTIKQTKQSKKNLLTYLSPQAKSKKHKNPNKTQKRASHV
jgi:hypothetical protein